MMNKLPTLDFVVSLVREMGKAILPFFGDRLQVDTQDRDLHTIADEISEKIMTEKVKVEFPEYQIMAEEISAGATRCKRPLGD